MTFELFSQRRLRQSGDYPPKPTKTVFSRRLRDALHQCLLRCIGSYDESLNYISGPFAGNSLWDYFHETMLTQSDEYHGFKFSARSVGECVYQFFATASDAGFVDALDLATTIINRAADKLHRSVDEYERGQFGITLSSSAALQKMDELLRTNGTIYRITDGAVVVSTDDFTHEEAIVPALQALALPGFENALREFHDALSAYRSREGADVLTKANHAFESTMKVIASKMKWEYNDTDTAKALIDVMISNGLMPKMRESALTGLRVMLESDVPTLRNKVPSAGHGAGTQNPDIPEPFITYALNAAASNIRLLVELYVLKRKGRPA